MQATIAKLNLRYIRNKLLWDEEYEWTEERIDLAIQGYREFLQLYQETRKRRRVPGKDVDTIWHLHILHTKKYAKDCQTMFGEFLHHNPSPAKKKQRVETECGVGCECASCSCD